MSSPSLWSKLCAFRPEDADIPLFKFWVEKSSPCPLDLTLVQGGEAEWGCTDAMHGILEIALAHSSRWRSITLLLFKDMEELVTTYPVAMPLPCLQSFDISLKRWTSQGSQHLVRVFSSSSALRSVFLRDGICPAPLFIQHFPWALLHTIVLCEIALQDLLEILPLATSLKTLGIGSLHSNSSIPPTALEPRSPIVLPYLSTLRLSRYINLSPLFNSLHLPSLSSLTLRSGLGLQASPDVEFTAIKDLSVRSGCRIDHLCWSHEGINLAPWFMEHAPAAFPHLRDLDIELDVPPESVAALTQVPEKDSVFPLLRSLRLRGCTADRSSVEKMLSSRPDLQAASIRLRDPVSHRSTEICL
ncbi:hypothetical protein NMY22_g9702 [Coprinellus aureogranulatus]|nr:hypothetical protein NMY22_g9702 [Coprinellus aureogranulatus]